MQLQFKVNNKPINLWSISVQSKLKRSVTLIFLGSILAVSGCQSVKGWLGKYDNGSLDYQQSKKLAPLTLPADQETAAFVPLYPTPKVGANTLTLTNETGKQFKLPPPERTVGNTN